jgi:hypothetical protein
MMDRIEDETVRYLYFPVGAHEHGTGAAFPEEDEEAVEDDAFLPRRWGEEAGFATLWQNRILISYTMVGRCSGN